jgi:LPXTG-motif cell wall-anchored protein
MERREVRGLPGQPPPARRHGSRWILRTMLMLASCAVAVNTPAPAGAAKRIARSAAATSFELQGDVAGLYPNATVVTPIRVHNPQPFIVTVETAQVTVGDARPGCSGTNVTARSVGGEVVVPANGDATLPVEFHMPASTPDACQGASFPLTFVAQGVIDDASGSSSGSSSMAWTGSGEGTIILALVGLAALLVGGALVTRRRNSPVERSSQ